jgi:hypothetical protein
MQKVVGSSPIIRSSKSPAQAGFLFPTQPSGTWATLCGVKQIWTGRMGQAAVRYGDQAPMVTVCCNACRTCVSTNLIGLATAAASGAALAVVGFLRRLGRAS